MGLGLRYSFLDELADRLDEGRATGLSFVEVCPENYMRRGGSVPAALRRIAEHLPVLTHGLTLSFGNPGELGGTDVERRYLDVLAPFLASFDVPHHSDHLCLGAVGGRYTHDLLPLPFLEEVVVHAARRIRAARERLGVPIAIENISYYLAPGAGELDEATFLSALLAEADASLLLDVNNVVVNGKNFGTDARALVDALPLARVVQLHVAGHRFVPAAGRVIDNHGAAVSEEVLALMAHVVEKTGPLPVVLERDAAIPPLDELLDEVSRIAEVYDRAIAAGPAAIASADVARPYEVRGAVAVGDVARRLAAIADTLIASIEAPAASARALAPDLAPSDHAVLAATDELTWGLYRGLVRRGLGDAVRLQLPRAAALRGESGLAADLEAFVDRGLPSSPFLRDVPRLFVQFARPRWTEDPSALPGLADLADHEVAQFEIAAMVDDERDALAKEELDVSASVRLKSACRLARYAHPVHELDDGPGERSPRPTSLLTYRDADGAVRVLSLTPVAAELFARLRDGMPLGAAIGAAATAAETVVTAELLAEVSSFLADLAERGVLLGRASDDDPQRNRAEPRAR